MRGVEREGDDLEPTADADDGGPEGESQVSSADLLKRVILGLIEAVGEGVELVGVTIREELARSRREIETRIVVLMLMAVGVALMSSGLMLLLRELVGTWSTTLVIGGGAHVAAAIWLSFRWRRTRPGSD